MRNRRGRTRVQCANFLHFSSGRVCATRDSSSSSNEFVPGRKTRLAQTLVHLGKLFVRAHGGFLILFRSMHREHCVRSARFVGYATSKPTRRYAEDRVPGVSHDPELETATSQAGVQPFAYRVSSAGKAHRSAMRRLPPDSRFQQRATKVPGLPRGSASAEKRR